MKYQGKHPINHRGAGGKEYDSFQLVMSLISFPPVEDNFVSTELSPVKGVNSALTYQAGKATSELAREQGIKEDEIVKLASNENPLAREKFLKLADLDITRYPDSNGFSLKQKLAAKHSVDTSQIVLGNGSNDVLDMIARAFLTPEDSAMFSQYAFLVYPLSTKIVGANAQVIPAKQWGNNLDAMRAAVDETTKVIFIANPNNPTGTWLDKKSLHKFIASLPTTITVVIDEAYIEYVNENDFPDATNWLNEFDNLIVTRTFSKAYGLAGLRVGYSLSSVEVAEKINAVRQPFNVNSIALAMAEQVLGDDEYLAKSIELNRQGMLTITEACDELGLEFIPSLGNFVAIDFAQDAEPIYQELLKQGVIVRPVVNYGMPNHLRVTVGLPEENNKFIETLRAICKML